MFLPLLGHQQASQWELGSLWAPTQYSNTPVTQNPSNPVMQVSSTLHQLQPLKGPQGEGRGQLLVGTHSIQGRQEPGRRGRRIEPQSIHSRYDQPQGQWNLETTGCPRKATRECKRHSIGSLAGESSRLVSWA